MPRKKLRVPCFFARTPDLVGRVFFGVLLKLLLHRFVEINTEHRRQAGKADLYISQLVLDGL